MHAARHQTGNVRHVEDVYRTDLVGNLPHAGKVPEARIGAGAADDDLGLLAHGDGFHLVIVDQLGVAPDVVKRGPIKLAA